MREFAVAAASSCGMPVFVARRGGERGGYSISFQRLALQAAIHAARRDHGVAVMDEAEKLLGTLDFPTGTDAVEPGMRDYMDRSDAKVVWITGNVKGIPDSLIDRFAYSVRFGRQTSRQMANLWEKMTAGHRLAKFFTRSRINHLSETCGIRGETAISSILRTLEALDKTQGLDAGRFERLLKELIAGHARIRADRRRTPSQETDCPEPDEHPMGDGF
jgi:hypothetical protein